MTSKWILLAGATVGAGLYLMILALAPAHPDLHQALVRLHQPPGSAPTPSASAAGSGIERWSTLARWTSSLAQALRLGRYRVQLRLTGQTAQDLMLRKVGYGLLGLAFPVVLVAACRLLGVAVPFTIPVLASLLLAGALFWIPDLDLRRAAGERQEEMRAAVLVYIDLVALERAADAGPTEALDRAAALGGSDQFQMIAAALRDAELVGRPAWTGLADLGDDLQVPELVDLADIMTLSGRDGAAVYTTLRARAASLRTQLLTARAARANAASEHMIVPVALLGIAFMALVGYPAFARILYG